MKKSLLLGGVLLSLLLPLQAEAEANSPKEVRLVGEASAPNQELSLWYRQPSTNWMTSSLPIGNGEFGAMVFGGVSREEIQFNDKTLWSGTPSPDGVYQHAKYGAYQNFGNIYIDNYHAAEEVSDYRRELDLERAISRVGYSCKGVRFEREYFVSNPDSLLVVRLTASKKRQISFDLRLVDSHDQPTSYEGKSALFAGKLDHVSYYARMEVVPTGGKIVSTSKGIQVRGADEVVLVLRGTTDYDPAAPNYLRGTKELPKRVDGIVQRASAMPFNELRERHVEDYRSLFNRVSLNFDQKRSELPTDELIKGYNSAVKAGEQGSSFLEALYFHYGRYLLISSSRGVATPANLQGIWNHVNNPPWASDIHANINVQMNYWPAEITNLSECHFPFLEHNYLEATQQKQWSHNALDARKAIVTKLGGSADRLTSAKGWVLYTENNIFGAGSTFAMNNVSANAWNAMHIWQHYRYTLDEEYLHHKGYPILKACSEFWLERLIADRGKLKGDTPHILRDYTPDGTLVAPLEYSPEHGPGEEDGTAHAQQLCWDLFNNTLQAMDILGARVAADTDFKAQLQAAFAQLDAGLHIDTDGHLREWKYTEKSAGQRGHRHNSHLMGLYPGNQISPQIDRTIFDAAVKSLDTRGDVGTGWSMGWKINLWARARDGERAHKLLRGALNLTENIGNGGGWGGGVYENLFDAHPPFQIDGNFGACAGIAEMLLQSQTGTIELLPALPSAWPSGEVKGLRTVGGFEVDIRWTDGAAEEVVVRSDRGQECRIAYPKLEGMHFFKNALPFEAEYSAEGVAIIQTEVGDIIRVVLQAEAQSEPV